MRSPFPIQLCPSILSPTTEAQECTVDLILKRHEIGSVAKWMLKHLSIGLKVFVS